MAEVEQAAAAGPSRLEGEQYVLAVANLLTDPRPGVAGEEVVRSIAASEMDAHTRAFLADDLDGMRQLGWGREIDTGLDLWIRSAPSGPAEAPTGISVEVVMNVVSPAVHLHGWDRMRYDIVRDEDTWKLVLAAGGSHGIDTARNLTPHQRHEILGKGQGWRRIPAAVTH